MDDYSDILSDYSVGGSTPALNAKAQKTISDKTVIEKNQDILADYSINGSVIPELPKQPSGLMEAITGNKRIENTPELGVLPEFGATKQGDTFKIAAGMLSTFDPEAQTQIIKSQIPDAQFEKTQDGSIIITVPDNNGGTVRSVLNRPGFSQQDMMTSIAQALSFIPAAKISALGKTLAQKVGFGAVTAGSTEIALQESGKKLGREELDPASIAISAALGGAAETISPAIRAIKASREASKVGVASSELEKGLNDNIATASKASKEADIPLFKAQQTLNPSSIEKQAFVAQLPAGSNTATAALKMQNEASTKAVNKFIKTISSDDSIVTGASKVRQAARQAIENAKIIRAEKASPVYKQAFSDGADVNLKPVKNVINDLMFDQPSGGEITKTLSKVSDLLRDDLVDGVKVKPSLKKLHNAKIELDQMLNKFGDNSLGNTTKRAVEDVKSELLKQMDDASPLYKDARNIYAAESPRVTSLQDGIIGKIANLKDDQLKQVSKKLFDASESNPDVLKKAMKTIKSVDKDAWNKIVRTEFERRLAKVANVVDDGLVPNAPANISNALFPKNNSTKMLFNSLDGDARKNLRFIQTALNRARLGRPGGSQTAIRADIKEELKGGVGQAIRDFISHPVSSIGNSGVSVVTATSERAAYNARVKALADVMFDPRWNGEMADLRVLKVNDNSAKVAMAQLLKQALGDNTKDSQ